MSMQQREAWLTRRAAELSALFVPSQAEQKASEGGAKPKGVDLARWLCNDKLMTLAKGDKVDAKVWIPFQLVTPENMDQFVTKN